MIGINGGRRITAHIVDKPGAVQHFQIVIIDKSVIAAGNNIQHGAAGVDDVIAHIKKRLVVRKRNSPEIRLSLVGNGRLTIKAVISERAPEAGRVPSRVDMLDERIDISAHLLAVLDGILVGADMYLLIDEHGIVAVIYSSNNALINSTVSGLETSRWRPSSISSGTTFPKQAECAGVSISVITVMP